MKLDESSKRRDTFRPGVPIVLADGQSWHFPRPLLGLVPEVGEDGAVRFGGCPRFDFGPAYDDRVEALAEAEDGPAEANALLALAVDLLRRNYDLALEELAGLLPWYIADEANAAMWRAIADVAVGRAPKKPMPVG